MIYVLLHLLILIEARLPREQHYGYTSPQIVVAYVGESVEMFCSSWDLPHWMKEGGENHTHDFTLTIKNLTGDDSGMYICRGTLGNRDLFLAKSKLFVGSKWPIM